MTELKQIAAKFAEEHNLCPSVLENAMSGTIERVQKAMAKGEPLTQDLIIAAMNHYIESMEDYHQRLENNTDGEMDKLKERVLAELSK